MIGRSQAPVEISHLESAPYSPAVQSFWNLREQQESTNASSFSLLTKVKTVALIVSSAPLGFEKRIDIPQTTASSPYTDTQI